ncbi:MAG: hypothetical protein IPO92_23990 [Saprospiraceae bacterium]|nr:hypothetical protein [Saprospiraceae bacterium]
MDDLTLWSKLKNGEQKAFKEIYDRHIRDLENYCKKFTKDIELIEDTLHDLFVQIWQRRDSSGIWIPLLNTYVYQQEGI